MKVMNRQLAWQRKMYRHRYRMTMRDMQEAGLNPMLAAELGAGSVPSGASGTPIQQDIGSRAVGTALEAMQGLATVKNINANTSLAQNKSLEAAANAGALDARASLDNTRASNEAPGSPFGSRQLRLLESQRKELEARVPLHGAMAAKAMMDAGRVSGFGVSVPGVFTNALDQIRAGLRE